MVVWAITNRVHALKRFLRVSRSVTEHFRKENKEISIQLASKLIISRSHHRTIIFISRASQTWDTLLRVGSRLPFLSKGNTGTWVKKESFVLWNSGSTAHKHQHLLRSKFIRQKKYCQNVSQWMWILVRHFYFGKNWFNN